MICSLIVSCESELEQKKDESYSFVKIEYYAADDCREFPSYPLPSITFFNNTDAEQVYPYTSGRYRESSRFETDDWGSFSLEGIKGMEVFVPADIDENNIIYLGNKKWEYRMHIHSQESDFSFSTTNVIVPPRTVAVISCKLFQKHYKANYKLFLKKNQTGEEKITEGIWTGIYLDHPQIDVQCFDLN